MTKSASPAAKTLIALVSVGIVLILLFWSHASRFAARRGWPAEYLSLEKSHPNDSVALERLWGIYQARPDLQKAFDLQSKTFVGDLVCWGEGRYAIEYVKDYATEQDLENSKDYARLCDEMRHPEAPPAPAAYAEFETSHPSDGSALKRLWDIYAARPDLQSAFGVQSPTFVRDLTCWAHGRYAVEYAKGASSGEIAGNSKAYARLCGAAQHPPAPAAYAEFEEAYPSDGVALKRLWEAYLARPDLQNAFSAQSKTFVSDLVCWGQGRYAVEYLIGRSRREVAEYSKSYARLCAESQHPRKPSSFGALEASNPSDSGALRRLWDIYQARPDLQKTFDVRSATFTRDLLKWAKSRYPAEYSKTDLEQSKDYTSRYSRLCDAANPK